MHGPLGDEGSPSMLRIEEAFLCQFGDRFAHGLTADVVLFDGILSPGFHSRRMIFALISSFTWVNLGSFIVLFLLWKPRGNLPEPHPSPDIRYVMYGSLDTRSTKIYNLIFYSSDIFFQVHPLTSIPGISFIAQCS